MKLNTDPNAALADVLAKVNSVRSELPSGIEIQQFLHQPVVRGLCILVSVLTNSMQAK